jgi:hypothetical protein
MPHMFHAKRYVSNGIVKLVIDEELVKNPKSLV